MIVYLRVLGDLPRNKSPFAASFSFVSSVLLVLLVLADDVAVFSSEAVAGIALKGPVRPYPDYDDLSGDSVVHRRR